MIKQFTARYPEFAGVDETRIMQAISDAELELSRKAWGRLYERGLLSLAAHLLEIKRDSLLNGGAPSQAITSKSAGGLSIGYASPDVGFSSNHGGLALTKYGQEYLRLVKLISRHFLVIR